MKMFFDGGCQPNPGMMEVGVVADGTLYHERKLGHGTNNQAEWLALVYALRVAQSLGQDSVEIWGDSMLVVNQANGVWQCRKEELKPFLAEFKQLRAGFRSIKVGHVRRAYNLAGIALESAQKASA